MGKKKKEYVLGSAGPETQGPFILGTAQAYEYIKSRGFASQEQEHFLALFLDSNYRVLSLNTIAIGSSDSVVTDVKSLFRQALLANAEKIVLAHNHPGGGFIMPSPGDRAAMRNVVIGSVFVGIPIVDHLIINPTSYRSMRKEYPSDWDRPEDPMAAAKDIRDSMEYQERLNAHNR